MFLLLSRAVRSGQVRLSAGFFFFSDVSSSLVTKFSQVKHCQVLSGLRRASGKVVIVTVLSVS